MPRFRDLTVCITDSAGNDLKEWGVQHLRSQNKTSAYIQATTNMVFRVTVQPSLPFQHPDCLMACCSASTMNVQLNPYKQEEPNEEFENLDLRATENSHLIKQKEPIHNNFLGQSVNYCREKSYKRISDRHNRHNRTLGPSNESTRFSSPLRSQSPGTADSPAPYHLLGSLFLDGRKKPERKVIVYLDPDDEDFAHPDGKVSFRTRWVQGRDGSLKEHSWVFKDVGIETAFDKMLISGSENYAEVLEGHDEDAMIAAMGKTDLAQEGNNEDDQSNVGQILVVFERVLLGPKWQDNQYRSKHQEGEEGEDVDMAGMKNEITHTTGLEHTGTRSSRRVRVVNYFPYIENEKPYATFQFFYRSQKTLEKFGFPGYPRSSIPPIKGRRHMGYTFTNVTPLSIAHPVPLSKRKGRSFEENIKDGTFSEANKKYKCNDTRRQLAAIKSISSSLPKRKHSPSATSTLSSIKSARTNPHKRLVQIPETLHQGDEQNSDSGNSSVRPSGFTAMQTSQAALSMSSLPNSIESSANTLSSSVFVSYGPDSSTQGMSTDLAPKYPKPETKEGSLNSSRLDFCTVDTKAAVELIRTPCSQYRVSGQASDADDELDESDIELSIANTQNTDADLLKRDSVMPAPEQDDQGLHTKLQKMLLIPSKKCRTKEGINDEYNSESSATSPLKFVQCKMKSSASRLGLSSGTAEDADDEDDATKENCPPVEKVGQFVTGHRVKRERS